MRKEPASGKGKDQGRAGTAPSSIENSCNLVED